MFVSAAHSVFYDLDIYFVCYKCDSRLILAFNTTLSVRCILFVPVMTIQALQSNGFGFEISTLLSSYFQDQKEKCHWLL